MVETGEMPLVLAETADPLYEQVRKGIRNKIRHGQYKVMDRLPSQVSLASHYGVSQITVRRAIQELVYEGLLVARPGSGTYVADTKHAKNSNLPATIAIIFQDIVGGYPLVKPLFSAIRNQCREFEYGLQFMELPACDDEHPYHESDVVLDFAGAILTSPVDVSLLTRLGRHKIPHVLLHNDLSDGASYCVSCNYAAGIMQATLHLLDSGCRNLLLITAEQTRYSAGQMALGFELACGSRQDVKITKQVIHASYAEHDSKAVVEKLLSQREKMPDGIIFPSDITARAGLLGLLAAGVKVPDEVAIVGFGNILQAGESPIDITVVDSHNEKTGMTAMNVLHDLIQSRPVDNHRIQIQPELIIRASSSKDRQ